ncbi:MAG: hypothetical protein ACRD52_00680 [Candidatus Acidiferrales bacterium]
MIAGELSEEETFSKVIANMAMGLDRWIGFDEDRTIAILREFPHLQCVEVHGCSVSKPRDAYKAIGDFHALLPRITAMPCAVSTPARDSVARAMKRYGWKPLTKGVGAYWWWVLSVHTSN